MGSIYPGDDPPAPGSTAGGASVTGRPEDFDNPGPGPYVMACETLAGDSVVNRENDDLGKIDHIMIDVPSGRIAYAVLACGGVFGIGEKLFAVPWSALTLDTARKCFVLDIPKSRFEEAPGFDKDHWPAMADNRWATQVHDFYGVRPYWADRDRLQ